MLDVKKLQKEVYQNKLDKGFNTTDINKEFCRIHEEVSEAYHAWNKKIPDLGAELADVVLYILGLSEILDIDLEQEILDKFEVIKKRQYKMVNGVSQKISE